MPKREAAGERADVAVVIVNYGTAELAISGVESVLAHHHGGRHVTVHLIDNASPGDDAALLAETYRERAWSDRVTLYQEPINHGFGRGNNIVLRTLAALAHPPDKVMLLNPDARLTTETVAALADCLDAHPHAAVAGAGINRPGGEAVAAAFRFPSLAGEFAGSVRSRFTDRLFAHWLVARPPNQPTGPVDWVSGAAMMIRMRALIEADFFDPDYFLYFEETDLMHRLARKNWQVWHVAGANIEHAAGAATGLRDGRSREKQALPPYWYESWRLYFVKNHGRCYAIAAALAKWTGMTLNSVLRRMQGRPPDAPRHFNRDFRRYILAPLLFSASPGKPQIHGDSEPAHRSREQDKIDHAAGNP